MFREGLRGSGGLDWDGGRCWLGRGGGGGGGRRLGKQETREACVFIIRAWHVSGASPEGLKLPITLPAP